jgi:type IV pilus assembly protein PilA
VARFREERTQGAHGFTLIELLVVVVIIGILIAIAIPLYLNYKRGANDKSAMSDLRGAVTVLEQCNADYNKFPVTADVPAAGGSLGACCSGKTVTASGGTTFAYFADTSTTHYLITSTNSDGSGKVYCYASAAGGSVKTTATMATGYLAGCP